MSRRSSSDPSDRFEYLQTLVTEFQDTDSDEAKEQVLANLANFAYDPSNMEHLRELQVADLFLDVLTEENDNFVEFGMGGLCNLSMDPESRRVILESGGINLVTNCLSSRREETVLSAITTLMNLVTPSSRSEITDPAILQCMLRFSLSQSPRLRGLAAVFLQDCCTEEQVARAQRQMQGGQTALGIPLPEN
ncbi:armadillo repeat-containing protein 7 [Gasterosteus aculeatus]|uniref:Armadillo repeat containing 7 n=1 Tax=Gasterosteus aculeatus aculeatus TaxID=481459 RepID=A0AAQ4Q769_GASAC|nr:armadillo repeat-containing protein 7 [Gasterosteus aculeatus aculeatus]